MDKKSLNDIFVLCKENFHRKSTAFGLAVLLVMLIGIPAHPFAGCTDEFLVENNTTAPTTVGQSWTTTFSGTLQSITVKADTPNAGLMTLKIYNGQSLAAGDLLSTQNNLAALVHGENTYAVSGVTVTAGQQYTFLFTNENDNGIKLRYDVNNGYAGGQASFGAGFVTGSDIWFKASVLVTTNSTDEFLVENTTTAPPSVGQSWTPNFSGTLQSISVKANTPNAGLMTLKIYNGQSVAAPDLLSTQTNLSALVHGENTYAVGSVTVTAGQQYTFLFTNQSANGIKFRYDVSNGYAGGQATAGAGFVAGSDIWFKASVLVTTSSMDEFLAENNTTAPPTVGQSWTATCDGTLQSISVKADTPNDGLMTLRIYDGESLAGSDLLSTQNNLAALVHGENTYAVDGVTITAGQQYTFLFTNESANGIKLRFDENNGYTGGQAYFGAGFLAGSDIWFKALVRSVTLTYTAGIGGTIVGANPQTVGYGANGSQVTAQPDAGYRFVKWSDEVATATRQDTNVMADITVSAEFTAVWTSDEDLPEDLDLDGNSIPDRDQENIAVVSNGSGLYFGVILPDEIVLEYLEWIDDASVPDMNNRPDAFPLGLVTFRLLTAFVGDTIELTIYCSQPIPDGTIWYKHDPVNGWYDYSDHAVISEDRMSVTLTFQDGGIGDADGIANGTVEDPSGPTLFYGDGGDRTNSGDDDGQNGGGDGGCFLQSVFH